MSILNVNQRSDAQFIANTQMLGNLHHYDIMQEIITWGNRMIAYISTAIAQSFFARAIWTMRWLAF